MVRRSTRSSRRRAASPSIQVGYYELKKEMQASDAFDILSDPGQHRQEHRDHPRGLPGLADRRTGSRKETDYPGQGLREGARRPGRSSGCPTTRTATRRATCSRRRTTSGPRTSRPTCSRRWWTAGSRPPTTSGSRRPPRSSGYTPHEIMTVASLIEAEGRGDYSRKIARVIYNRLEIDPNPAAGFLQIDATVNYALGRPGPAVLTTGRDRLGRRLAVQHLHAEGAPARARSRRRARTSIKAALNPEEGPWFFYVTINLETGETKFTDDYNEFLTYKGELQEYCETQSDRC